MCDNLLKSFAEKFNIDLESSTTYDVSEKFLKYRDQHQAIIEKEYNNQFLEYRNNKKDQKNIYINKKLGELAIHQNLRRIDVSDLLMGFYATKLYPSAMWDDELIYPEKKAGYLFTIDELV